MTSSTARIRRPRHANMLETTGGQHGVDHRDPLTQSGATLGPARCLHGSHGQRFVTLPLGIARAEECRTSACSSTCSIARSRSERSGSSAGVRMIMASTMVVPMTSFSVTPFQQMAEIRPSNASRGSTLRSNFGRFYFCFQDPQHGSPLTEARMVPALVRWALLGAMADWRNSDRSSSADDLLPKAAKSATRL